MAIGIIGSFNVSCVFQVTGSELSLSTYLPRLTSLHLHGCHSITDALLHLLPSACPSLRSLRGLCVSAGVTDRGIAAVVQGCRDLRVIAMLPAMNDLPETDINLGRIVIQRVVEKHQTLNKFSTFI